ncbi:hypothetical protein N9A89_06445 [Akkermansiaceae bacterium]|nr:hypothetical protein [Akkermansiaceae bacterium]MDB4277358.1 hypothetical protein [bacterium]MDA7650972.1 hypothetical protein [Akkermansiaceae bacterium]MDA7877689.1 hypothetical protein [Akkermansiaceae bacterium]MDB4259071.1 hypothetical protein [Akkermansiaceae bacterium]
MKPRITVDQALAYSRQTIDLVEHDGRFFLECIGRQVDALHTGRPAQELMEMTCQPFRAAKQPRIIFLGLGFGHAVTAARHYLPQEKATFVVFPEAAKMPEWVETHLPENPLDDERVEIETLSPFNPIPQKYSGSQAVVMDLDHLEGLSPSGYKPAHPQSLANIYQLLKSGGLLGIIGSRLDNGLKKSLQRCGFDVVHQFVPLSEKSKKNRTLYLARKGHYQGNR